MDQGLSPVELRLMFLMNLFENYSVRQENDVYLNKKELRMLLEKEAPFFISVRFLPESGE